MVCHLGLIFVASIMQGFLCDWAYLHNILHFMRGQALCGPLVATSSFTHKRARKGEREREPNVGMNGRRFTRDHYNWIHVSLHC